MKLAADFMCGFTTLPLRLPLYVGIAQILLGMAGALGLAAAWATGVGIHGLGWWIAGCAAFGLLGVPTAAVGLLGLYVSRTLVEVRRRPPYVIDEILGA